MTLRASEALTAYAERARELKRRVTALGADVEALDELILGNDDWQTKIGIVDQRRETYDRVSALAQEILDSDAECASALNALAGGETVTAPVIQRHSLDSSTDWFGNVFTHVQHFLGTDEQIPDQPWGPANASVRLGGIGSTGQGFLGAIVGAGQGLYTLLGTSDKLKQAQAWQSMWALAGAVITTKSVIDRGARDLSAEDVKAVLTVAEAGKTAVHYDEWGKDPWYAGGAVTFDVASLFVGGSGAGLKAGTLAGKAGRLTEGAADLSKAASGLTTATRGALSEATAAVASKLGKARIAVWNQGIGDALRKLDEGLAKAGQSIGGLSPEPSIAGIHKGVPDVNGSGTWLAHTESRTVSSERVTPPSALPDMTPRAVDHTLGDATLPGRHPDLQPVIGDTDGGVGRWEEPTGGRSLNGVPDQIFGTGVETVGPNGKLLEYVVVHDGMKVDYDGHFWRGHPPIEIYQEIKGNYSYLDKPFFQRIRATDRTLGKWIDGQLDRQLEALPPGARLEWIFTRNEDLARRFQQIVREEELPVDVKYIPLTQ
ncbi:hypothetical protein ACFVTE_14065 [Arthrobacter sp. NPDC058097]|uniref:hypothetical protein n=1 Tax=Arthrobacter sp. NPDC058097 TaxID=3346340 RepID=UPI0036D78BC4